VFLISQHFLIHFVKLPGNKNCSGFAKSINSPEFVLRNKNQAKSLNDAAKLQKKAETITMSRRIFQRMWLLVVELS